MSDLFASAQETLACHLVLFLFDFNAFHLPLYCARTAVLGLSPNCVAGVALT